jgi:tetratricopeptide (TPR) repeat protein
LTDHIDAGGMGTVYKAEDLKLERVVAVKIVTPTHSDPKTATKRFIREAKIVSKIGHPNVITVHDIVEENGDSFLVMEYIDGPSLRARMTEQLDLSDIIRIASEVGAGLGAAHDLGVVHRDVKPENIMITKSGLCKVLDFGVAQLVDTTRITTEGRVIGTAHYMAPEQLRGHEIDARTDIYALGVVLFEMLAGRRPFVADEWEALQYQIVNEDPPWLTETAPGVPDDVEAIVRKALEKDPAKRYQSMSDMLHDLDVVRDRLGAEATGASRMLAHKRRRRRVVTWTGAAVSLMVALVVWQILVPTPDTNPRILVMRAANSLADDNIDYLSGGIMDGLIAALAQLDGYNVITRATVTSTIDATDLKTAGFAPNKVLNAADQVGADYLVMPSFAQSDNAIRVECELKDVGKGVLIGSWSQDMADLKTDFYPVIGRLAADIAFALGAEWREEPGQSQVALTESIEALRHYQHALDRFEMGDYADAVTHLRLAVKEDTTFAAAYLRLARLSPDRDEQTEALQRAMIYRHGAPQPFGRLILASQLEWDDQIDDAVETFRSILADYPEDVEARKSLAKLLMYVRRFGDAAAEFSVLKRMNPFDYSFYDFWWMAYGKSGRSDRALAILEEWREQFPDEPAPLRMLVSHHLNFGSYDAIGPILDRLAELSPGSDLTNRGFVYMVLGRMNEAENLYEGLLDSPDPRFAPGRSYTRLARLYYQTGEYEKGLEYIRQALNAVPDFYNSWIAGLLAAANGQPDVAREHIPAIKEYFTETEDESEVVEALSERRFYYHLLGEIALAERNPSQAVEMHQMVIRFCSRTDRPFFGTYLGLAYLAAENYDNAVAEFEEVLSINPNYPRALLYLGQTYLELGESDRAKEVLLRLKQVWKRADEDYVLNKELNRLLALVEG